MDKGILRTIGSLLIAVILLGALAFMLRNNQKQEQVQIAKVEALREQARPYEQEIRRIRQKLEEKKEKIAVEKEICRTLIGYQICSATDLEMVKRHAKAYDFSPIIVLDCLSDDLTDILSALRRTEYEIVLTGMPYDESVRAHAQKLQEQLKKNKLNYTGVFLLRSTDDTEENLLALEEDGYTGCVRYIDVTEEGIQKNGLSYMGYSYIKSSKAAFEEKVSEIISSKQTMTFVFDLNYMESGDLDEQAVLDDLDILKEQLEDENLVYSTISDALNAFGDAAVTESERQAVYDDYAEKQMKRMEELESIVDEIYSHWDEE